MQKVSQTAKCHFKPKIHFQFSAKLLQNCFKIKRDIGTLIQLHVFEFFSNPHQK